MNKNQEMWHECIPIEDNEIGIAIKKDIEKKLRKLGRMFSSYSSVIEELLDHCNRSDQFWENRT